MACAFMSFSSNKRVNTLKGADPSQEKKTKEAYKLLYNEGYHSFRRPSILWKMVLQ